jgi:signal peptidase II
MNPVIRRHLIFWYVTVLGAALDLISKTVVFDWLEFDWAVHEARRSHQVIDGFFRLETALNTGTFFGRLRDNNSPLIIFTVLMMALVIIMFLAPPREMIGRRGWSRLYTVALGLVLAGALGNLWDRVKFSGVRDFLAFSVGSFHWPTFNLADAWLTAGICAYLLATWRAARKEKQEEESPASDEPGKAAAGKPPG